MSNHTLKMPYFPLLPVKSLKVAVLNFVVTSALTLPVVAGAAPSHPDEYDEDQIEIIEGEDRIIYEYRQNGVLTMIKVVPENGRPYYMVPADGSPNFEGLDHKKKLYPQWVIVEW
jgi:hypothetical protein